MRLNLGEIETPSLVLAVDFAEVGDEKGMLGIGDSLGAKPGCFEDGSANVDVRVAVHERRQRREGLRGVQMERTARRENAVDVGKKGLEGGGLESLLSSAVTLSTLKEHAPKTLSSKFNSLSPLSSTPPLIVSVVVC